MYVVENIITKQGAFSNINCSNFQLIICLYVTRPDGDMI